MPLVLFAFIQTELATSEAKICQVLCMEMTSAKGG